MTIKGGPMLNFAKGGHIAPAPEGPRGPGFFIERLGVDADGHCLYSINGGEPEHIAPASDAAQLTCPLREVTD